MVIVNDGTGNKEIGNYEINYLDDDINNPVTRRVENFERKKGVWELIKRALIQ